MPKIGGNRAHPAGQESRGSQRVDKWLWHARFRRTRTLAAKLCEDGKVRLNGDILSKPSQPVRTGDTLTFPQGRQIRVIRVIGLASRRGPASKASELYEDLSPDFGKSKQPEAAVAEREPGAGRPTKRHRRQIEQLQDRASD